MSPTRQAGNFAPVEAARKVYKSWQASALARRTGLVRRIDRVAPPKGRRVVAMTFDDGPCGSPARPGRPEAGPSMAASRGAGPSDSLTATILSVLRVHGARGTFNVIGTTRFNYPDVKGKPGGVFWSGTGFDHYPEYGRDELAGVLDQPSLARRMVDEGHELSNHGLTHTAFGPSRRPYGARRYLPGLDAVIADLRSLHQLVKDTTGFTMRLGRPPHYVDRTVDGSSAYDAYRALGYLYLGASFDGGGWKASGGGYAEAVEAMVHPLEALLARAPEALNGAVVFQKDGYNMSLESPVADGLRRHLELLKAHGYEIVTVSELLSLSPFTDIGEDHPAFPYAAAMLRAGYAVAFADNEVKPERPVAPGDAALMCATARPTAATEDGRTPSLGQLLAPGLLPERGPRGASSTRSTSIDGLVDACLAFLGQAPLPAEEREKRLATVRERALRLQRGRAAARRPLLRGEILAILSATLVG